jgi:hypothetical protein
MLFLLPVSCNIILYTLKTKVKCGFRLYFNNQAKIYCTSCGEEIWDDSSPENKILKKCFKEQLGMKIQVDTTHWVKQQSEKLVLDTVESWSESTIVASAPTVGRVKI